MILCFLTWIFITFFKIYIVLLNLHRQHASGTALVFHFRASDNLMTVSLYFSGRDKDDDCYLCFTWGFGRPTNDLIDLLVSEISWFQ